MQAVRPVKPTQDSVTVLRLRRGIGVLGIAIPIMLPPGHALFSGRLALLGSISGYYHTEMRDVFVGGMCAIGVFLICYRYRKVDDVLSTIAGLLMAAVALLPTTPASSTDPTEQMIGLAHQICAATLFVLLAGFCFFLFTRVDPGGNGRTPRKRIRNGIYYACGSTIIAAIVIAALSNILSTSAYQTIKPLFWCEALAVLAFGIAWLVKGETVFKDRLTSTPDAALIRDAAAIPAQQPPADSTSPATEAGSTS